MIFLFNSEKSLRVTDVYVMRHSACLVFNPIMVDNCAALIARRWVGRQTL